MQEATLRLRLDLRFALSSDFKLTAYYIKAAPVPIQWIYGSV